MKKSILFFFPLLIILSINVLAEVRNARIFDVGQTASVPRFTQVTTIETVDSEKRWASKITDAAGAVVMTEKATIKDDKIIFQYVEQLQTGFAYELNVAGKEATFQTYKLENGQKGKTVETEKVTIGESFMTGPVTESFVQKNWAQFTQGKTLKADFGVFELSKVVGFNFKKENETESFLVIQMRPSNLVFALLVDPIYIEFDKKQKKMVRFRGRTPLRVKIKEKWEPYDAEITYL